ncbi:MAG: hypothetical protein PHT33_11515 [bacterium]|nr:hypothetical protein [bacterium]
MKNKAGARRNYMWCIAAVILIGVAVCFACRCPFSRPPEVTKGAVAPLTDKNKLPVLAGDFRLIASGGKISSPMWSPDGQKIAYFIINEEDQDGLFLLGDLYVVHADGSGKVLLAECIMLNAVWTSDSRSIIYEEMERGLEIISIVDKKVKRLVQDGHAPSVSADGKWLAFHRLGEDGSFTDDIYIMSLQGNGQAKLITRLPTSHETEYMPASLRWSATSDRLIALSYDNNNIIDGKSDALSVNLWQIDLKEGTRLRLAGNNGDNDFLFTLSPNESSIVFIRDSRGERTHPEKDIWLMHGNGSAAGKLTSWGNVLYCDWVGNDTLICQRVDRCYFSDGELHDLSQWGVWLLNRHTREAGKIIDACDYALSDKGDLAVVKRDSAATSSLLTARFK